MICGYDYYCLELFLSVQLLIIWIDALGIAFEVFQAIVADSTICPSGSLYGNLIEALHYIKTL